MTTLNIDLTGLGTTTPYIPSCYCYTTAYSSPAFSVQAGDIVNFGNVIISSFQAHPTPDGGPLQGNKYVISWPDVSYNPSFPATFNLTRDASYIWCPYGSASCNTMYSALSDTFNLTYLVPDGASSIQVAWFGPATYTPPDPLATPLPAALPLFVGGLLLFWARRLFQ